MIRKIDKRRRKGVVMVMFTMMMLFVIMPAVGLALDAGVMFAVKAKMQSAADGAALSAARSLSRGYTFESQQAAATETATKFYHINIENGWLGLQAQTDPVVTFPDTQINTMTVKVAVEVNAPTYFMRILGPSSVTLRGVGEVSRRFVNLVLILDRSTSLNLSSSCGPMKSAAEEFSKAFLNGTDNMALVTFGATYRMDFDLDNDFLSRTPTNVPTMISNINCGGYTNAASGYSLGAKRLVDFNQPGALNVIVFFTDGQPTALHMPAIPIENYCTDKSNRNGVLGSVGSAIGISIAFEPNAPGSVPSSDWNRPVDNTDADTIVSNPDNGNCKFKTSTSNITQDTSRMTLGGSSNWKDYFGNDITSPNTLSYNGTGSSKYVKLTSSNIENASVNALVSASSRYRAMADSNGINLVTFAVGLGNTSSPPDANLLKRVSNDPTSANYNSSYPAGKMIYASNTDELHAAFARLASEILRITM